MVVHGHAFWSVQRASYFRAAHGEGSAILRNSKQDLFSSSGRHDHFQQNLRKDTGKFAGSFSPYEISQFEGKSQKSRNVLFLVGKFLSFLGRG